jgi:L-aminopeptidase/D-esterase-like protein
MESADRDIAPGASGAVRLGSVAPTWRCREDIVMLRPGPLNLITDVPGLRVGHATDEGVRSGVTVLLFPGGWTAAADVRGGGPATREIDVLGLENLVGQAHAICFSGGSVFGLAAADGVTAVLSARGEGLAVTPGSPTVPIVAAACLYDLGNDGDKQWGRSPPYRRLGELAADAACNFAFDLGAIGAGRGARAGSRPGGVGSASLQLAPGLVVGALAAVNPVGSVYTADGRSFHAHPFEIDCEFGGTVPDPSAGPEASFPLHGRLSAADLQPGTATTLCVIAVSAGLSRAECKRVAMMAQDGLARAIRPAHTPFDGDIVLCVAQGAELSDGPERPRLIAWIGAAAADTLARAIARGVHAAAGTGAA